MLLEQKHLFQRVIHDDNAKQNARRNQDCLLYSYAIIVDLSLDKLQDVAKYVGVTSLTLKMLTLTSDRHSGSRCYHDDVPIRRDY